MIHDAVATFWNAIVEAGSAVRIKGLSLEPVVVRGDLCERAAERMTGDGHFRCAPFFFPDFLCITQGMLGQRQRIGCLRIGPRGNHGCISEDVIDRALGAAVRHHYLAAAFAAIDRALVAIRLVIDMLENSVALSFDRDDLFLPRCAPTYCTVLVDVIGKAGILRRRDGHGATSLAANVIVKSLSRISGLNSSALGLPMSGKLLISERG